MTTPNALEDRQYQTDAIKAIDNSFATGHMSPQIVMAPGCGKTQVFLGYIEKAFNDGWCKRALVLAHTKDLVRQPTERINKFFPGLRDKYGMIMNKHNDVAAPLIFGSRDTMRSWKRLSPLLAFGNFDLVVIDESHHSDADTCKWIVEQLRNLNPQMRVLGCTATPKENHGHLFDDIPVKITLADAISMGILCPVTFMQVKTGIDMTGVEVRAGDFVRNQVVPVYETVNALRLVVKTHMDYAAGRPGIAFTLSVEGATALAATFNANGIPAVVVSAATPDDERERIVKEYFAGNIKMICNVGVYTEGKDIDIIEVVHMVVPIHKKSAGKLAQSAGRGFRKAPGKTGCIVFEYAPIDQDLDLAFGGDLLGLPITRKSVITDPDAPIMGGFTFDGETKHLNGNPAELIAERIERLARSGFYWLGGKRNWQVLHIGKCQDGVERAYCLAPPDKEKDPELYAVRWYSNKFGKDRTLVSLVDGMSMDQLVSWSEAKVEENGGSPHNPMAKWRNQPVTSRQKKWGELVADCATAGEARDRIVFSRSMNALKGELGEEFGIWGMIDTHTESATAGR